ncbi:MAG: diacylglycerol kinase family protein [bacterium]
MSGKFSIISRVRSFGYAFRGIFRAFSTEHNLWIQGTIAILVIIAGFSFDISHIEWLGVVLAIGLVFSAELMNTAVEQIVDFISPDFNRKAGYVKDAAAGAVLIAAITSAIIGCLVFIPYIIDSL